jgi:hypothetical protein
LEEFDLAEQTYQKGIEITANLQNEKALKELKGAYQMFLDERRMVNNFGFGIADFGFFVKWSICFFDYPKFI